MRKVKKFPRASFWNQTISAQVITFKLQLSYFQPKVCAKYKVYIKSYWFPTQIQSYLINIWCYLLISKSISTFWPYKFVKYGQQFPQFWKISASSARVLARFLMSGFQRWNHMLPNCLKGYMVKFNITRGSWCLIECSENIFYSFCVLFRVAATFQKGFAL